MPVFNDWQSVDTIIQEINLIHVGLPETLSKLVLVNDGSDINENEITKIIKKSNIDVEVINLKLNLGHQRSIAIGLCHIHDNHSYGKVIVMDSDGEDSPFDYIKLLDKQEMNSNSIVVASRSKRQEKFWFRSLYWVFKLFFYILTGAKLNFGNFTLLNREHIRKLVLMSDLWNNYPSTIIKSKFNIIRVPIERSRRLFGKSKLNFISFILHGFGAISVFSEIAFIRMLILSFIFSCILIVNIFGLIAFELFSKFSLPEWTNIVIFVSISTLLIVGAEILLSVISFTAKRNTPNISPLTFYQTYINSITKKSRKNEI
jgi:hypothetical protein